MNPPCEDFGFELCSRHWLLEFIDILADLRERRILHAGSLKAGAEQCGPPMTAGGSGRDERVQPRADSLPGMARPVPGGFAHLGMNSFYVPRHVPHARSAVWDFGHVGIFDSLGTVPDLAIIRRICPNGPQPSIRTFSGLR